MAAGAWTGELLNLLPHQQTDWDARLQPRKGYLLLVPPPAGMPPLRHGLMESSYTNVSASPPPPNTHINSLHPRPTVSCVVLEEWLRPISWGLRDTLFCGLDPWVSD